MCLVRDDRLRAWVQNWVELGPILASIRRRELEAMTDAQVREAALDLLTFPISAELPPRLESGLVEQQRWFSRLHPKK
jgi:hypothetical protein